MNYSRAIRTIRATKGITQKQLASLANMDASYISRIEKGDRVPTLQAIETISRSLKVPLYLLTLLASEQKDLSAFPEKETSKIAEELLNVLLHAQKESQGND